jgi:hypothetical protein
LLGQSLLQQNLPKDYTNHQNMGSEAIETEHFQTFWVKVNNV